MAKEYCSAKQLPWRACITVVNGVKRCFTVFEPAGLALLPHCKCDAWLAAHIVADKFVFAIPLYRQEQMFQSRGEEISRDAMCRWLLLGAGELEWLYELFRKALVRCRCLNGDETTMEVFREPGRPDVCDSFMWLFLSCGENDPPVRYCEYAPSRASAVPLKILAGFKGFLQADGYPGYKVLAADGSIVLVGCLAHVRRKFVEVLRAVGREFRRTSRAREIVDIIRKVFMKERQLRKLGLKPEEFLRKREEEVLPILGGLHAKIAEVQKETPAGGLLGKACTYAMNQWKFVAGYLKHPDLTPSNNLAERGIKSIVMGRKNYLFCQSPEGARAAAIYYTLTLSAKACGLNPECYVATVFYRMRRLPKERWEELLPWNIGTLEPYPDYMNIATI